MWYVLYTMQIFVFFPDAAKVGVKDIKVSLAAAEAFPELST
jgi:hypothetical protein